MSFQTKLFFRILIREDFFMESANTIIYHPRCPTTMRNGKGMDNVWLCFWFVERCFEYISMLSVNIIIHMGLISYVDCMDAFM